MVSHMLAAILSIGFASAQIPPPSRESRLHHILTPHRDFDDLQQRYSDLQCALAVVRSGDHVGSGFYISADGDIVTAAHVLGNKTFSIQGGRTQVSLQIPDRFVIHDTNGEFTVQTAQLEQNGDQWGADVAVLRSGHHTACWLRMANDADVHTGEHVVALGFPGLAFGSLSIYTGIVSSRLHSDLIIGFTPDGQPMRSDNELFRVQMPISPGLSGGAIVDDENRAVAVISSAGASTPALDLLADLARRNALPPVAPNTIDLAGALAQLAQISHDFSSPGYGDAVPLRYLGRTIAQPNQRRASPVH